MSRLEKLQISGFRAFSPDEKGDPGPQKIDFYQRFLTETVASPLTVILGQNGCGKTTIIECLKYATTGSHPPGSYNGRHFIHDPGVTGKSSVVANVKLQFIGNDKKRYVISRGIQATKAKTISIKTLDSTLSYVNNDGDFSSLSSKCSDINIEVQRHIGVSEAILNYVIFCHQDESNWPLEEGGKVKERFDLIFAADKYNTLLKEIKVVRKSHQDELKMNAKDMEHFRENKKVFDDKEKKLRREMREKDKLLEELKVKEEAMAPVISRLKEINEVERDFSGVNEQLGQAKARAEHCAQEILEIRQVLQNQEMAENADEIERMKEDMKYDERKFLNEKGKFEGELNQLKKKIEMKNESIEKINMKVQKCQLKKSQNNELKMEVKKVCVKIGKILDWPAIPEESYDNADNVEEAKENLEATKNTKEREKIQLERDFDEKIEKQMDILNELSTEKTKLETKHETIRSNRSENNKKLAMLKRTLSNLDGCTQKIQKLSEQLKSKDAKLEHLTNEVNLEDLDNDITENSKKMQDLDEVTKSLRNELKNLENIKDLSSSLSSKKSECSNKKMMVQKILNKHQDDLEKLFEDTMPANDDLKRLFNKINNDLTNEKSRLEQTTMKAKSKLEHEKEVLGQLMEDVKNGEMKIKNFQTKLGSLNSIDGFDANLNEAKENVASIRDELQVKEANKHSFQQFIEKMKKNQTCPTCQRGFKNDDEVKEVIDFLKDEIEKVPQKVKFIQKRLNEAEKIQHDLEKIIPEKSACLLIRNELETKHGRIQDARESIAKLTTELKKDGQLLEDLDEKCQAILNIRDDIVFLDNLNKEIKTMSKVIHDLEQDLENAGGDSSKDFQAIQADFEVKVQDLERIRDTLDKLRSKKHDFESQMNKIQSEKNAIFNQKLTLESQQQDRVNTEKEKAELEQKIKNDDLTIETILKDLKPISKRKNEVETKKYELLQSKESEVKKALKFLEIIKDEQKHLEQILNSLQDYNLSGNEDHLEENLRVKHEAKEDLEALKVSENDTMLDLTRVQGLLNTQASRSRCLEDNLKLKKRLKQQKEFELQKSKFQNQIRDLNLDKIDAEKRKLKIHVEQLEREKNMSQGRLGEIAVKVSDLEQELLEERLATAAEKYRKKLVEKCARDQVIKDLDTYYKALDWAIMRFHKEKMKRINLIIKELWRQTYRGNDIDYIEIRTDDGEVAGGADKKKSYNYRVIMNKGKSELEMRGRCSAGQKVLASLIIRLALAETFSTNCGIIALDEPTTNLDRDNIQALAEALGALVVQRAHTNFQLIVITHDDELLDHLGKVERVDHYYKISRNANGFSVINKKSVKD